MDFSKLQDQVSNLTLYDIKAGVRKVQNGMLRSTLLVCCYNSKLRGLVLQCADRSVIAVMNYTEMEAKVRIPPELLRATVPRTTSTLSELIGIV